MDTSPMYYQRGYGGLGMLFTGLILGVIMYFTIFPNINSKPVLYDDDGKTRFCKPYLNDDGSFKDDAPTITAPAYSFSATGPQPVMGDLVQYRLIKSTVPMANGPIGNFYSKSKLIKSEKTNEVACSPGLKTPDGRTHYHFCQWVHEPLKIYPNFSGAYQYAVTYPANYTENAPPTYQLQGKSVPYYSDIPSPDEGEQSLRFGEYKIIFLIHLDKNMDFDNPYNEPIRPNLPMADIYQQASPTDITKPLHRVPDSVLSCYDGPGARVKFELLPVIEKSPDKKQQQLGWFVPRLFADSDGWYWPSCKPAVYLYPEKEMAVNVKVAINNGFLTYTDPLYAKDSGWNVLAKPSGTLTYLSHNLADSKGEVNYPTNQFPYLYYEGKIQDSFAQKPDTGFIKSMDQLPSFFDQLLPKLGLNPKETSEFKDYWLKALPTSPYYFIGIIPQDQLDQNEPLTISPKENTMIRIRLFFEALEQPIPTTEPELQTPVRSGFTVVDWGGMVKQDKDHPFTCIQ